MHLQAPPTCMLEMRSMSRSHSTVSTSTVKTFCYWESLLTYLLDPRPSIPFSPIQYLCDTATWAYMVPDPFWYKRPVCPSQNCPQPPALPGHQHCYSPVFWAGSPMASAYCISSCPVSLWSTPTGMTVPPSVLVDIFPAQSDCTAIYVLGN